MTNFLHTVRAFLFRWAGAYPVNKRIRGVADNPFDHEPVTYSSGYVQLPNGTWVHGGPRQQ